MNFQLTKEQEFVRKMVREFATNEVEPLAADIDKEHRFPVETVEKMAKYGLLGIPFPTQYGGAGGDHISYTLFFLCCRGYLFRLDFPVNIFDLCFFIS